MTDLQRALLTTNNAMAHLHHFCNVLSAGPYVDSRPEFEFKKDEEGLTIATVTLPISVDPAFRHRESARAWLTERKAKKDAAFQAYKGLYDGGLINNNLLPFRKKYDAPYADVQDERPSIIEVSRRLDPWGAIASQATRLGSWWTKYFIKIGPGENPDIGMSILLPAHLPHIPSTSLHWSQSTEYTATTEHLGSLTLNEEQIGLLRTITHLIYSKAMGQRIEPEDNDFVVLLLPCDSVEADDLQQWLSLSQGEMAADSVCQQANIAEKPPNTWGLLRELESSYGAYVIRDFHLSQVTSQELPNTEEEYTQWVIEATKFPRRRDFLHAFVLQKGQNSAFKRVRTFDASKCVIDRLPASAAMFAIILPSLLHRFEIYLVAQHLQNGLLKPVRVHDLGLILTAITATAAAEHVNYQRLEFLGDCVLKVSTSVTLTASQPNWPESYLTAEKSRTNSNRFLSRASRDAGLDRYLILKRFTGAKWKPQRISSSILDQTESQQEKIKVSTKTMADIVESLIGASYVQGGLDKAIICMQTLLPSIPWLTFPQAHAKFASSISKIDDSNIHLEPLEALLGHTFRHKQLLLEAITHPSFTPYTSSGTGIGSSTSSYQRLEFLGDAILDLLISRRLFSHNANASSSTSTSTSANSQPLPHHSMHTLRTALVNAHILAFLSFEHLSTPEARIDMHYDLATSTAHPRPTTERRALWQFMRCGSSSSSSVQQQQHELAAARQAAVRRHEEAREGVWSALRQGTRYPWALLVRARAEKFFSDLVESVVGAIYVDVCCSAAANTTSVGGSGAGEAWREEKDPVEACEAFVRRLGLLELLERFLRDGVDCLHPKERLGRLAVADKVEYVKVLGEENGVQKGWYGCRVRVGERDVGALVVGSTRMEAETEAALRACEVLEKKAERTGAPAGELKGAEKTTYVDRDGDLRCDEDEINEVEVDDGMKLEEQSERDEDHTSGRMDESAAAAEDEAKRYHEDVQMQ
jgi:dsRNA-specific ribonuclease